VHILTRWQTPAAIHKAGYEQVHALLKRYKVNNARQLATAVITAARAQTIRTAGEAAYATVLGQLAADLRDLSWRIDAVDAQITDAVADHPLADIVQSMPGMGAILIAEFLAHAGADTHPTPSRLAAHAEIAPINRDSGGVNGNLKRPQRFHRVLRRVFHDVRPDRDQLPPRVDHLLPAQTRRRHDPPASHRRPRPPPHHRPLDHDPKPAALPRPDRCGQLSIGPTRPPGRRSWPEPGS
jgi:Transposase IS116/IS110/IS902 family